MLPDVQNLKAEFDIFLNKVGVNNVKFPFKIKTEEEEYSIIGICSLYVDLDSTKKGVHMSRFIEILNEFKEKNILDKNISIEILKKIKERLESQNSFFKIKFLYKLEKKAPKSNNISFQFYDCCLDFRNINNNILTFITIKIPYISTCICSKELSIALEKENLKGAPHQQRAYITFTVQTDELNIKNLIELVEKEIKTVPYELIKRIDEQELAKLCWENTFFVEDIARKIAFLFDKDKNILDYVIIVESQESIHTHNAISVKHKYIEGGLK